MNYLILLTADRFAKLTFRHTRNLGPPVCIKVFVWMMRH